MAQVSCLIKWQSHLVLSILAGAVVLGFLFAGKDGINDEVFRNVLATLAVCMTAALQALR